MKVDVLNFSGTKRFVTGLVLAAAAAYSAHAADLPKGLVLHLNFDKAETGNMVVDASPSKISGRVVGAKWDSAGKQGGAYTFNGASSIQIPSVPALAVRQVSLAAWFKTSKSDTAWHWILDKNRSYQMCIAGGDAQNRGKLAVAVNNNWCLSDAAVADDKWHHAAATYDGTSLKLYVDGVAQKQVVAMRGDVMPNVNELGIGRAFDGSIDEVTIFNRALTADEAKGLGTAGGDGKPAQKFTKEQVARRLRELKDLLDKGLITQSFYERKVEECKTD